MAERTQSPSPSPPPPQPTALTPGYRADGFIKLYNKSLDRTLGSVNYENFAACFPTIATHAGDALKTLHGGMVERLGELARADFDKILAERDVIANLNALDDLIADARKRSSRSTNPIPSSSSATAPNGSSSTTTTTTLPTPPHALPATAITTAHENPVLIAQNSQLNARLQTVQSQNASLAEEIRRQREEIESLLKGVESAVGDLERGGVMLGGERAAERTARARGVEGVLVDLE